MTGDIKSQDPLIISGRLMGVSRLATQAQVVGQSTMSSRLKQGDFVLESIR